MTIFVLPPSAEVLLERLRERKTESPTACRSIAFGAAGTAGGGGVRVRGGERRPRAGGAARVGRSSTPRSCSRERVTGLAAQVGTLIERLGARDRTSLDNELITCESSLRASREARRQQVPRRARGREVCARPERVPARSLVVAREEAHDALARGAGEGRHRLPRRSAPPRRVVSQSPAARASAPVRSPSSR